MVIADTNIFIATIRGNEIAEALLLKHQNSLAISLITILELKSGATDSKKKTAVRLITDMYTVLPLSKHIGERALQLVELYTTPQRKLEVPDALIAATCLEHQASLLTFNTKDFKFIKGLKFAK